MLKNLFLIFSAVLLAVWQLTVSTKLAAFSVIPNFVVIVSLLLLWRGFSKESLFVVLVGGLFLDLASPMRFGLYTFLLFLAMMTVYLFILPVLPSLNIFWLGLVFLGVFLLMDLVFFLMAHLPLWQIFPDVLINSVWGLLIFVLTSHLFKRREEIHLRQ